ncbi:MAG: circadian clock protein KaiC, partial [Phycisphaerales bacterium]|nr:circadian clock protein KaiC [Phycisphaerales bacterium]
QGDPGTGKTTLALQFLLEGLKQGEKVLFITLSETHDELAAVAQSHGWSLDGVHVFELSAAQQNRSAEQNTLFHPSEVELNEVTQVLLDEVERVGPSRVVLDSLSELRLLAQNALRFRRQILALKQHFVGKKSTVMLLDDRNGGPSGLEAEAHTVAHGVMELEQLTPEYGAERRRLRIAKLRGVSFRGGYHDMQILHGGLQVYPRLVAHEHRNGFVRNLVSSGVPELDALLGGGIARGTSLLIMGPAGSGKSTLSMQYVCSALERGENVGMFLFDEGLETMLARADGVKISLRKWIDNKKQLTVRQIDPAEMPPGAFVSHVRDAVENHNAKLIIIDSLNGYMNAMPEERYLTLHMHELLAYLAQRGVMTILVMAQHGLMGKMESQVDISYLSDSVLLLRYFEAQGHIRLALSVVKKRTGPHERTIREMMIVPDKGIRVGEPLIDFQGILTGVPTLVGNGNGKSAPLLKPHGGSGGQGVP